MTDQPDDDDYLQLLVFSDDASVREEVKTGVGRRPAKGLPLVTWTDAATAEGVRLAIKDREVEGKPPFDALVLDAETKKLGGMGLLCFVLSLKYCKASLSSPIIRFNISIIYLIDTTLAELEDRLSLSSVYS